MNFLYKHRQQNKGVLDDCQEWEIIMYNIHRRFWQKGGR